MKLLRLSEKMQNKDTQQRSPTIYYPIELENNEYSGDLYGYFHEDSNAYNIVSYKKDNNSDLIIIGNIDVNENNGNNLSLVIGKRQEGDLHFYVNNQLCEKKPYELLLNVFSRNTGIIETDFMLKKSVVISGLGSVGSLIALELARSGVGKFLLIDNDIIDYHNICRHQCGVRDVGSYKVSAVEKRILDINPYAKVTTASSIIEDVPKDIFEKFINPETLIIGCADNRQGDLYANTISNIYQIPFVSIGFWERAFAGEIFYSIPGETPCYECVFGGLQSEFSKRVSTTRRHYTNEPSLENINFEPGISVDIGFITNIGIKLIIDLLNLANSDYTKRLLGEISQFTLVCNTNNKLIGGRDADLFSYPLQVTTSIKIDHHKNCSACQILKENLQ